jgi:hypothetical protein
MTIPLVKEDAGVCAERGGLERCHFCTSQTRYWHVGTNNPVCQVCAKQHRVAELPIHRRSGRAMKFKADAVRDVAGIALNSMCFAALLGHANGAS